MDANVAVFRDEEGLAERPRDRPPPQGGGEDRLHRRPGHASSTRTCSARSSSDYMLDCAEAIVRRRARAQGVPRRAVPHRLPRAQRRGVAQAHRRLAQRRRRPRSRYSPVTITQWQPRGDGPSTRWPSTRSRSAATSPSRGEAPYWEEFNVELEPHRSVLDGLLQAKDDEDGSIGVRCSCRAAICGSCGVRINGQPGARLQHPPRRDALATRRRTASIDRRADGQHARHQGPDHRHGRGRTGRRSSASRRGSSTRSRSPSASTSSRASRWSTSPRRWPASSAAPASRTASRWRPTRCSSARPRWRRPTASSATRATPSTRSA